ncbi:MAG: response regulator [Pseudomonadales bacterium]|nr:response regulator [Pseudomonadales bacterium]
MNDLLLLVDDDEVFLATMERSLKRRGQQVIAASASDKALAIVADKRPARVLLDLNLGGESGLQVLAQILALAPSTQVIMLTGYASIATAVEAIKKGACDYLCKPATAKDVIAAFACDAEQTTSEVERESEPEGDLQPLSVPRLEWEHIQRVLNEHEGNISATARALGMHRRTLQRKLQKRPPK